jgi:hypothetical protein
MRGNKAVRAIWVYYAVGVERTECTELAHAPSIGIPRTPFAANSLGRGGGGGRHGDGRDLFLATLRDAVQSARARLAHTPHAVAAQIYCVFSTLETLKLIRTPGDQANTPTERTDFASLKSSAALLQHIKMFAPIKTSTKINK